MNNNYGGTTGLGLEGTVTQPSEGFGLPEENVAEQSQPTVGMPTSEEIDQYNNQRAMASAIDGPVQYAHEKETARMDRADSLLDSLKTNSERQAHESEQKELDARTEQIQSEAILRNEAAIAQDRERLAMQYVTHPKQPLKVESKALDPVFVEKIKKTAKDAALAAATLGVVIGIGIGAHHVLTQPEFVPEQTPQSIELQEQVDDAENFDQVVDAVNENKEQQIESGITTHPEHVVDDSAPKVEEEQTNMSDSMQDFVDEVNRQKVIRIESGVTNHPEHVVDDSQGGRGL